MIRPVRAALCTGRPSFVILTEKVFPRQAEVLTVDRWVEQLNAR